MSKTISRYKVDFIADTGKYQRGLDSAERKTKSFRTSVGKTGRGLAKGATAIAAFGAAALTASVAIGAMLVRSGLQDIDRISKFSFAIGMTTESLAGLEFSSNLAGSSAAGLKTGLTKLQDTFSRAASGNQASIDKFESLGLSMDHLATLSADDRFLAISDAMAALPGPVAQSRAAIDLFGKSGVDLIGLLVQGSDALREQQGEARKLGLVFDREGAAKVEMANDAMAKMTAIATGLGRTMAIELAPFIQATAETLTSFGTEGMTMSDIVVNGMEWVATAIGKVADWLELAKVGWYGLQTAATAVITGLVLALEGLAKGVDFVGEALGLGSTGIGESMQILREEMVSTTEDLANKTAEAWERFNEGANSKAVGEFFDEVRTRADDAAEAIADAADARNALALAAEEELARQEEVEQQQEQATAAGKEPDTPAATATAFLLGSAGAAIAKAESSIAQKAQQTRERTLDVMERMAGSIEQQAEWSLA